MTEVKVRLSKDGAFPINKELAGLVPMAGEAEQAVLTQDIGKNEQQDPIVLWQGRVVDGRCRMKALELLGKHIMYRELDDKLSEAEVRVYVKSANTRRNLTQTQKVMSACKDSLREGSPKLLELAKDWGIGDKILKNARFIAKERPEFIQPLFDGYSVKITSADGHEVDSNKVTTIYAAIKRDIEAVTEGVEHAWSEDTFINTQAGKEWYYEQLKTAALIGGDVKYKMLVAELANYKFVLDA